MSDAGDAARLAPGAPPGAIGPTSLIERMSAVIAVLGGVLLFVISGLVVVSVIGRRFFDAPVNGDFELVSMGAAIAVFTCLPYCQARRGNIFVDTFTGWLPPRVNACIDAGWDLVYAVTMGFLAVCLADGTYEHYRSGQTTMLLQLIIWPAIAISCALTFMVALVAIATAIKRVRGST